ncbi:unnamed protein product [Ostreobium quekettii]|uniref:ShKT domain-containing protein n=1 Tax=Ostreobium quekettii TaxID=121088 RepID=A0A8S1IP78_9CHLO|nr:unnamed protein product [Ostreobium quekettii]|eukprot:evm.model.scf_1254.6 EVM.evm.TU.scf_1254.6   scf_1254:33824-42379(+)
MAIGGLSAALQVGAREMLEGVAPSLCTDDVPDCKEWAASSACLENPFYTREHCAKSCGVGACARSVKGGRIGGYATMAATRQYATQFYGTRDVADGHFRWDVSMGDYAIEGQKLRGDPWLMLSSLGVGTYLGAEDEQTDKDVTAAILQSLSRGWNVIDTASNYRHGRAERCVGEVFRALHHVKNQGLRRDSIFLSTKAGFISDALRDKLMKESKIVQSDLAQGVNCIHTECIRASLQESLENMGIRTVDLLYLHNAAETYIPAIGRPSFFALLRKAFIELEDLKRQNHIRSYGLATWNCFRTRPGDRLYLSLEEVVELAREVGGRNHGFRYIQLPISLTMDEAWSQSWQTVNGRSASLMEAAAELGVGVFASGPLQEGDLLKAEVNGAIRVPEWPALSTAQVLLQISRSTPYLTATLVGHKTLAHVAQNTEVAFVPPLDNATFHLLMGNLKLEQHA